MVLGWRRAFCTSISRDRDPAVIKEKQEHNSTNPTSGLGSKFRFFSNPPTPRFQSQPVFSHGLRCRTTASSNVPAASAPGSPKLRCKTKDSPRFFHRSNPSSPRSPSAFSLLKSSLSFSKSRCGICLRSVKTGQGMAIFTAECSHSFHFPCIAAHMKKEGSSLACPVCSFNWKEMPLLSVQNKPKAAVEEDERKDIKVKNERIQQHSRFDLKVYNDDEPLMSPTTRARFNPIPESDEDGDEEIENGIGDFQGFFVNRNPNIEPAMNSRNVGVVLLPEVAVVSGSRSSETYAVVLKVRAPPAQMKPARRAPIDLVIVLDVSGSMTIEKMQMMKRAMRLVVSSLSSSDRLSIVAFSAFSKRLLPLRRMTTNGRQCARRIIDALAVLEGTSSASDALKKAAKVLEDRRERNPVASIMLLSEGNEERPSTTTTTTNQKRQSSSVSSTRFARLEIPVQPVRFNQSGAYEHAPSEDTFAKCVRGLLSVVAQDIRLQLGFVSGSAPGVLTAVYSYTGQPVSLGSGSIRLGNLYAEEERELLLELKIPSSSIGAQRVLSVRCCYRDPSTEEVIYGHEQVFLVPRPSTVRSSSPGIQRLRTLFITTRALAESRKLIERGDFTGAHQLLSSARALLLHSASSDEFLRSLETELSELHLRRLNQAQLIQRSRTQPLTERDVAFGVEKGEPLTPTSAWKAAERLAKVAIMRKSLNRVSDLHGFEDARF